MILQNIPLIMSDLAWSAPFDNDDVSSVTPVPYGDLHTVSPYVATPQVGQSGSRHHSCNVIQINSIDRHEFFNLSCCIYLLNPRLFL